MKVRGLIMALILGPGLVALAATNAHAVAGKFTGAPPGAVLSGGSLTLELEEPVDGKTEITVPVSQQGEFDTPAGVDQQKAKRCRYTNDKGETTSFRCGAYLAFGGGAAIAGTSGGQATSRLNRQIWRFDALFTAGGTTTLGSADASTTANVPGTRTASGGLSGLTGFTGGLMFRTHLPRAWTGPLGDLYGFFRWQEHAGRNGTGAEGDVHPTAGNDVSTSFKRYRDLEFGLGKSFDIFCRPNGRCQQLGIHAGVSLQYNRATVAWNESGGGGRSESVSTEAWRTGFVTGATYQISLEEAFGEGWAPFFALFGADFRYVPNMTVNGTSSTFPAFTYRGFVDPWEVTTWAGAGMSF